MNQRISIISCLIIMIFIITLICSCSDDSVTPVDDPPLPKGNYSGTLDITLNNRSFPAESKQQFTVVIDTNNVVAISEESIGYYYSYVDEELCEVEDWLGGTLAPNATIGIKGHKLVFNLELSGNCNGTIKRTCPGSMPSEINSWGEYQGSCSFLWEEALSDSSESTIVPALPYDLLGDGESYFLVLKLSESI